MPPTSQQAAQEYSQQCQQLLLESVRWCEKVSGHGVSPLLFGDITQLLQGPWYDKTMSYSQRLAAGQRATLVSSMMCEIQKRECPLPYPAFDVSGLPCPDMSAAGKRLKRAGETNTVYIAHGRFTTSHRTPLLLVECTKDTVFWFTSSVDSIQTHG